MQVTGFGLRSRYLITCGISNSAALPLSERSGPVCCVMVGYGLGNWKKEVAVRALTGI